MGGRFAFSAAARIERRAGKIGDPVERLRYLRQTAAASASAGRERGRHAWMGIVALTAGVLPLASDAVGRKALPVRPPTPAAPPLVAPATSVWEVENASSYEVYSNGLRIENEYAVSNEPRAYVTLDPNADFQPGPTQSRPAGIVFHTSESDQAPFEAGQNRALRRIGEDLLQFVRGKRGYHFVIDRFGRVYRIVAETDTANHAGHSIWADARAVYVDLNASFLGVAFEARTQADHPITTAQAHSGALLTEMLRDRYGLPPGNCVTHAQVSVNPGNMRIGWHTDWGSGFPFDQMGLPDNYSQSNPGFLLFGFEYDRNYVAATSPVMWESLAAAEYSLRDAAAERHLTLPQYRRQLQQRYRSVLSALRRRSAVKEN